MRGCSTVEARISNVIERMCLFKIQFEINFTVTIVKNTRDSGDIYDSKKSKFEVVVKVDRIRSRMEF